MMNLMRPTIESRCSLVYVGDAWRALATDLCHACKQRFELATVAAIERYLTQYGGNYRPFHVDCIVKEILEDHNR